MIFIGFPKWARTTTASAKNLSATWLHYRKMLVSENGLEPLLAVSETAVLPLDHSETLLLLKEWDLHSDFRISVWIMPMFRTVLKCPVKFLDFFKTMFGGKCRNLTHRQCSTQSTSAYLPAEPSSEEISGDDVQREQSRNILSHILYNHYTMYWQNCQHFFIIVFGGTRENWTPISAVTGQRNNHYTIAPFETSLPQKRSYL